MPNNQSAPKRLPRHIEHWDDERASGNRLIITLQYGLSFYPNEHEGVRGFDTVAEARYESAKKRLHPCHCQECTENLSRKEKP